MLFSDKIRQLRIQSGKRQKDLARAIGVDVPAYSRYEHGERRPKREQVIRLAEPDGSALLSEQLSAALSAPGIRYPPVLWRRFKGGYGKDALSEVSGDRRHLF